MAVNYEDPRLQAVETEKQEALTENEQLYSGMIGQADSYYQQQIDATQKWEEKQSQLQQEQTDFAIEQIEQQKEQAQKDYTKEQSGAYVDFQKQTAQHGANAEQMASMGMAGTGYSESSRVSMYNTYQNRVATARESFNKAVLNFNNAMKEARLQNSSVLAQIAFESLQKQLELSLQGFQYKNELVLDQANRKQEIENTYHGRWMDVLGQINTENAQEEANRQFEMTFAQQQKEHEESVRQFNENYALKQKEYEEGVRQFNEEIARLKEQDEISNAWEIEKLELQKQQLEEERRQFDLDMEEERRQFDLGMEEEKRQFDLSQSNKAVLANDEVFAKWTQYLKQQYPTGNITDENLWKELTKTYGEQALKDVGFYHGGKIESDDEPDDEPEYTTTNKTGNGWVAIGNTRMSWADLEKAIESGRVIEVIDEKKGTITFKYAPKGTAASGGTSYGSGISTALAGGTGGIR